MTKWAVFISGRGSNLQALLDLCDDRVALVVSNKASCLGVLKARRAGVPVLILDKKIDWSKLSSELAQRKISWIFLLGFMKIVPANFIRQMEGRIINLHPSLLPAFPGLNAIENSFAARGPMGCTIHWVTAGVDEGEALLKKEAFPFSQRESLTFKGAEFLISKTEHHLVRKVFENWRY